MKNNLELPRIVITMGEAAGVGPELIVRAAQVEFAAQLVVLANAELLLDCAKKLGMPLTLTNIDWTDSPECHTKGHLYIENHALNNQVEVGKLDQANATTTMNILHRASELALAGMTSAIVTAPVHKANLNKVDPDFLGHTEFLATQAGVSKVVMMLACEGLRVTLATTHLPLSQVPVAIDQQSLTQVIDIILLAFAQLNLCDIKVAVCGLNPHAGENGLLGKEDDEIILPVINHFQQAGYNIKGPFPADTIFTPAKREAFDVVLAMYHDQGLPVVKAFGFGRCANITLGLPYIRTSVDHGTALDIASEYRASADSLIYAINYAIELAAGKLPK